MWLDRLLSFPGRMVVKFITRPSGDYHSYSVYTSEQLESALQPCDVLLVEGNQWVSGAIKYLTQSTWSHAALYVGDSLATRYVGESNVLIEADLDTGVIAVPLAKYAGLNTRVCRPVGLTEEDRERVIKYMLDHLGDAYDVKNIVDLTRYLLPTPPVPTRFRRRLISLGSGDPTRAICSSLIAQAFQSVRYPILPRKTGYDDNLGTLYSIRHHSLFTPRDFDVSPYFDVIKPGLEASSDYQNFNWQR